MAARRLRRLALGCQPLHVGGGVAAAGIHAQCHRRMAVGFVQQGLPMRRPVVLESLDPPQRVIESADRLAPGGRDQCLALANEAPQHGIDERGGGRRAQVRRAHGLVDQRVVGVCRALTDGGGPQQRDGADQQRVHRRRRPLRRDRAAHGLGATEPAHDLERQRLCRGMRRGWHARQQVSQRATFVHTLHHVGAMVEQVCQRDRWRRGGGGQAASLGPARARLHAAGDHARPHGHQGESAPRGHNRRPCSAQGGPMPKPTTKILLSADEMARLPASERIRYRLLGAKCRYHANDNIAAFIKDGEVDELKAEVQQHMQAVLQALVIDTESDHNTGDTAKRVARMFIDEVFRGRYVKPPTVTEFPNASHLNELMIVGPVRVRSACSHHLCPILGKVWIGIMPNEHSNLIGLSKYARICDWVMTRPQIQEEAVIMLADELQARVKPDGLAIVMEADHFCMHWRGVKDDETAMTNSVMRGAFLADGNLRREFLTLLSRKQG